MKALLLVSALWSTASAVTLSSKNFATSIEGKSAFLFFRAPWCGHCRNMQPDWDKLTAEYKSARSVVIADIDCTQDESLCGKYSVQGYPTLKAIKKGSSRAEDYNGGRDFNTLKRYVATNLAGPECSLEDKDGCEPGELKILEASEAMSVGERREKIKALQADIKEKQAEATRLTNQAKELTKELELVKLGGEKPDTVVQLTGDAEFREHCEHRTCVMAFLPHILDVTAKERHAEIAKLVAVFKKAKADNHPVGFMWSQGGDQFETEEKLSLQFGFPAVVAVNLKKERFGVHRGTFDTDSLKGFISSMMLGKVPLQPIPKGIKWEKVAPWDGKDAEKPVEEEL